ncbi:MAG: hypothetical protein H0U42_09650 [Thermoleophilaceae bacterium]|nr:hypothetical protein [Thermoleophilaceae bacterium]
MGGLLSNPRFPEIRLARGHYESFFAKLVHPADPLGAWIRYTVHKPPGALASGSLWFTLFERGEPPYAVKQTFAAAETLAPPGEYIRIGESCFAPGSMIGAAAGLDRSARWELVVESHEAPYRHLPKPWMYEAVLPRTKLLSPYPAATFGGTLEVGGRRLELDGWQGTVGHNWGAQHAERWIWLHAASFAGHDPRTTWFDAALGRVKVGPLTLPWIANARLDIDGQTHVLGGPARIRQTQVEETPTSCSFELRGSELVLRGNASSGAEEFVGWVYADPDGSEHNAVNCSIATLTLELDGPQGRMSLRTAASGTYELGMRERDHGIALQPFPDG